MKYLNKLFAFDDRPSSQEQPAPTPRLTSTLYSVTFVAEAKPASRRGSSSSLADDKFDRESSGVTIVAHSASSGAAADPCRDDQALNRPAPKTTSKRSARQRLSSQDAIRETSSLGGYLLTATIGKTIASTSALASPDTIADQLIEEDDWILIEANSQPPVSCNNHNKQLKRDIIRRSQMALDMTDVELIRASWEPVRNDPGASGLLLFKWWVFALLRSRPTIRYDGVLAR